MCWVLCDGVGASLEQWNSQVTSQYLVESSSVSPYNIRAKNTLWTCVLGKFKHRFTLSVVKSSHAQESMIISFRVCCSLQPSYNNGRGISTCHRHNLSNRHDHMQTHTRNRVTVEACRYAVWVQGYNYVSVANIPWSWHRHSANRLHTRGTKAVCNFPQVPMTLY